MPNDDWRPISHRLADRLRRALQEATRNREVRDEVKPHLVRLQTSARQLREHLAATIDVLRDTTEFAHDLELDLAALQAKEREEADLALSHWDNIAQMATLADHLDDVFFAYDPQLWIHLLKTVEIDVYEEALGRLNHDRLILLQAPLQRVIGKKRQHKENN